MGASIAAWCAADKFDLSSVVIDSAYLSVDEIIILYLTNSRLTALEPIRWDSIILNY